MVASPPLVKRKPRRRSGIRLGDRREAKSLRLGAEQQPDRTVAGSSKRLASGIYQLKTGQCLTGQYLNWTRSWASAQSWWWPYRTQTREHVFELCPEWKAQQKILWAEVQRETGRGESRFTIREVLGDTRCNQSSLPFRSTTDVGRLVPAPAEEDAGAE